MVIKMKPNWIMKRMPEVVKWGSGGTPKATVKEYYENGMKLLLKQDETFDNYRDVLYDHKKAIKEKTELINQLYQEIKILKKLKV